LNTQNKNNNTALASTACDCYAKIKEFGDNNYSLDSEEIITCFLLSRGGIYIDSLDELQKDKALIDLQKAGFTFKTKQTNRIWVYPDQFVEVNNMVKA